jgi:hypothetical protein
MIIWQAKDIAWCKESLLVACPADLALRKYFKNNCEQSIQVMINTNGDTCLK